MIYVYVTDQDSTVGSLEYKEKLLAASFEVSINTNTVVYRLDLNVQV